MPFPHLSRNETFNLKNVNHATIVRRRTLSSTRTEHATTEQQEETLRSDLPTYSSIFLNTPTDPFRGEMTLDELSFQLNMQHHKRHIEDDHASSGPEASDPSLQHGAPEQQHDQSAGHQGVEESGHTTQSDVATDSQCVATSSTSTHPRSGTTVGLTVRGKNAGVYVACDETVQGIRDLLERSQDDHTDRPHRVRVKIALEVLKGNLSQTELTMLRAQLNGDTKVLASAMSQSGADYR